MARLLSALASLCAAAWLLGACTSSKPEHSAGTATERLILKDVARCADGQVAESLPLACSRSAPGKERTLRAEPYESNSSIRVYPGTSYGLQLRAVPGGYSGTVEFKPPADGDYLVYMGTPNLPILIDPATPSCSLYMSTQVTSRILGAGAEPCSGQFPGVYRVTLEAVKRYQLRFGPTSGNSYLRLMILPAGGQVKAQAVAAGYDHTCAVLAGGAVKCWGSNDSGQLGLGDLNARGYNLSLTGDQLPAVSLGAGVSVTRLALGIERSCALASDGRPKCWGGNPVGELGYQDTRNRGGSDSDMGSALAYVSLGPDFTAAKVAAGDHHTCAVSTTGVLKCWGLNSFAQLGLPHRNPRGAQVNSMGNRLTPVNLGTNTAVDVSASAHHTCAVLDDGGVRCWGCSLFGQLGQGFVETCPSGRLGAENSLRVDLGGARSAVAVTTGAEHTCVILTDGGVLCWGRNSSGQLGLGDREDRADEADELGVALTTVNLGTGRTAVELRAGENFTCARLDDGSVKCWGDNRYGQLGQGDGRPRGVAPGELGDALPPINLGTGRRATAISAGYRHVCALLDDRSIKCWGNNHRGELGLGMAASERLGDQAAEMGDALPSLYLGAKP